MTEEDSLQINFINWVHFEFPQYKNDLDHIANQRYLPDMGGGQWQAGRKLKRMGVRKGFADLFLGVPSTKYAGLFLELKASNGKLSPEQINFLSQKNNRGYKAIAVWGFQEAQKAFLDYIKDIGNNDSSV